MKRKRGLSQTAYLLLAAAAGLAALAALAVVVLTAVRGKNVQADYQAIAAQALTRTDATPAPVRLSGDKADAGGEEEEQILFADIPVDFDYLWGINTEVIAWLTVPGTVIDYPVLYSARDNDYYLNHTIRGETQGAASIYVENYNSPDFTDPNTVIYGHNMMNGTMFAGLHAFEDDDFFAQNDSVVVYTPTHRLTYTIFAAYRTDSMHILLNNDFSTEKGFGQYLQALETTMARGSGGCFRRTELTTADRLLTLSTCMGDSSYRFVVQAVLTEDAQGSYAAGEGK